MGTIHLYWIPTGPLFAVPLYSRTRGWHRGKSPPDLPTLGRTCVCKKAQNISDLPKQPFKTFGPFVALNVKNQPKFGHRLIRRRIFIRSFFQLHCRKIGQLATLTNDCISMVMENIRLLLKIYDYYTEAHGFVNKRIWQRKLPSVGWVRI